MSGPAKGTSPAVASRIGRALAAGIVVCLSIAPMNAWSQAPSPQQDLDNAARLALEAVQRMLRALQGTIDNLPQYSAPEILPNGDIIIRRLPLKRSPDATPPAPAKPSGPDIKT